MRTPHWARLLRRPARYKAMAGGRGSGKTHAAAISLVEEATRRPLRIACVREFQKSIQESAKRTIEHYIEALGLGGQFEIQRDYIRGENGSLFFFRGMSTSTEEAIRGWEAVDRVWVEEAQRMTPRSREILYPTIRKPGSEIWFSYNPRYRSDPIWRDFHVQGERRKQALVITANFNALAAVGLFPPELEAERQACLRDEPERYAHIWLGQPDDEGAARKVIPYTLARECVDAWDRRVDGGRAYVGLDVADSDGGGDKNAYAVRRGPCLLHAEQWASSDQGATTRRADAACREYAASALYYDRQGVGAGVRTYLREMGTLPYAARGVSFGGKVNGPKVQYTRGVSNEDFFSRVNAQLAWAPRQRALRTRRLMAGEDINPETCLFIDPSIPRLEELLTQISQPEREEDISGRVKIEKCPEDAPSPDLYDAFALSFAFDSRHGLRS